MTKILFCKKYNLLNIFNEFLRWPQLALATAVKNIFKSRNGYNCIRRNFAAGGESSWRVHLSGSSHWTCGPFFSIFFSFITVCADLWRRMTSGSLNCPYLPRSPLGWVRWCWRHRQVGHFAKIVSHLLWCSTPSLGRRRRRVSFQLCEKQLNVPGFIFGSLNLIFVPLRQREKDEEREKNRRKGERRRNERVTIAQRRIFCFLPRLYFQWSF